MYLIHLWRFQNENKPVFSIFYTARSLVEVTINRRLLIGRDGHLDQSEAYDLS